MNDRITPPMHALPDGEAEISLVVRLPWEDVARLGQEAGRLASQMQRPVTLDEAVSNRLRTTRPASHAKPAGEQPSAMPASTSASVSALPPRPPADQARQAIERINGTA
ncbi:hypothetical protein [Streptomyces canus]|uniref:hypothetical protein n=1 Tax=Streptomyces canus TaxID=58343 RepID=UPI00386A32AA|nr:hypothetical protein OH824_35500 [Streptomyces canus]